MFCKICNKEIDYNRHCDFIKLHLKSEHQIDGKRYFDEYLKKESDGFCLTCCAPTKFISLRKGYNKYCSLKCFGNRKDINESIKKRKKTLKIKYGNENYVNVDKIKKVKLERYGDPYYNNLEKAIKYWNEEKETFKV